MCAARIMEPPATSSITDPNDECVILFSDELAAVNISGYVVLRVWLRCDIF